MYQKSLNAQKYFLFTIDVDELQKICSQKRDLL